MREAGGGPVNEVYLYDAVGRLVATRGPDEAGEVLTYDGAQAVQARTWGGDVAWTASWGPGLDRLLSVEKGGKEYFALDDGKGSVVGWLDGTSNEVVGRAEYTPEGQGRYVDEVAGTTCEEVDGARCPRPLELPFGFHTAYASKTTGLLYFRNRWYSPEANQWLSQDALDAVDSFNLYAFNGFDSVNFVDPWGLEAQDAATQGLPEPFPPSVTRAKACLSDFKCWAAQAQEALRLDKATYRALEETAHDVNAAMHGGAIQFMCSMLPGCTATPPYPLVPDPSEHLVAYHGGRMLGATGAMVVGLAEFVAGLGGGIGGPGTGPAAVLALSGAAALVTHGAATAQKGLADAGKAGSDLVWRRSS